MVTASVQPTDNLEAFFKKRVSGTLHPLSQVSKTHIHDPFIGNWPGPLPPSGKGTLFGHDVESVYFQFRIEGPLYTQCTIDTTTWILQQVIKKYITTYFNLFYRAIATTLYKDEYAPRGEDCSSLFEIYKTEPTFTTGQNLVANGVDISTTEFIGISGYESLQQYKGLCKSCPSSLRCMTRQESKYCNIYQHLVEENYKEVYNNAYDEAIM